MLTTNFNLKKYDSILKNIIDHGYKFVKFPPNADKISSKNEVLLRHDIDFSLTAARKIAEHDYSVGIHSTFFIYLNSPFYNILFEEDKKKIDEIIGLGHEVALHFDERTNIGIDQEIEVLTKIFPDARFDLISIHKPRVDQLTKVISKEFIPHHYITTYDENFYEQIRYISDSKCNFNEIEFKEILKSNKSFQLLLHPIWWYFVGKSLNEKLNKLCKGKLSEVKENLKKNISIDFNLP